MQHTLNAACLADMSDMSAISDKPFQPLVQAGDLLMAVVAVVAALVKKEEFGLGSVVVCPVRSKRGDGLVVF